MKPDFSADALVQLVHRYYPAGILVDDPRYDASEEAQRLTQLLHDSMADTRAWKDFVQRLHTEFPDCSLWDATLLTHDPCYSCRVSLPGFKVGDDKYDAVVCLLSLLAPVYVLYASHTQKQGPKREHWTRYPPLPPEFQSHEVKLAGLIESTFGFTRLPNETLFTPMPDLRPRTGHFALGGALLIDCLFTPNRW